MPGEHALRDLVRELIEIDADDRCPDCRGLPGALPLRSCAWLDQLRLLWLRVSQASPCWLVLRLVC